MILLGLAGAWALSTGPGVAQVSPSEGAVAAPPREASVVAPAPPRGRYLGEASCASSSCHGATQPRQVFRVRQDEYQTWLKKDRHSQAYGSLLEERSRLIARNLGLAAPPEETPLCLACHSLQVPEARRGRAVEVESGVTCESCHGPAGGWGSRHHEEGWSHRDSLEAGMVDLDDLAMRTRLCLGCHLGDEGRTVDHRLLAAGHPQLVFELDNYGAEVSHWEPVRGEREGQPGAATWAVGQVAGLRESLAELARRSRESWPELAWMTCRDCHHSLAEERWRRGLGSPSLGLPRWSPARYAVLRHLVSAIAPDERQGLDVAIGRLAARVPAFGTPGSRVAQAAEEGVAILDRVVPQVEAASWDEAMVLTLLAAVSEDRRYLVAADYDAADQAFLALNTLTSTLVRLRPGVLEGNLVEAVEELGRERQDPYRFDARTFGEGLRRVADEVRELR
jgi:hypothetical protein